MQSETKQCKSCNKEFVIEPDDTTYYEKIGVNKPRLCPTCRSQRRLLFRNERTLYKRDCDKCGKSSVSMYSPNKSDTVWCNDCWFADDWDPLEYGQEYDLSRTFFEQYGELWARIPKIALIHVRSINSEYLNITADNKNAYMIFESSNNEDVIHCYWIQKTRDCVDTSFTHECETCYEIDDAYNCFKTLYSKGCYECRDSYFLFDCRNTSDSIACVNQRNAQYKVFNKQFTKQEYEDYLKNARLDTYSGVEKLRKEFEKFKVSQPHRFAEIYNSTGSTGNYIDHAKNVRNCFHAYDAEDCAHSVHVWRNAKDCMDCNTSGREAELIYNSTNTGIGASNCICTTHGWGGNFLTYCNYCFDCQNTFGCAGLRKKNYCILNRQYLKEEYLDLKFKIINQMKNEGIYGEFYPPELSPFGYNESSAQPLYPLTKKQVLDYGWKWENHTPGIFGKETVNWETIPDSITNLPNNFDMERAIFACVDCRKNYRIIPRELQFYQKLNIPLPRLCPDCRHVRRFKARGPNRTWERQCMCDYDLYENSTKHKHHASGRCANKFQTSYNIVCPEIVYCEQCYQAEVV